MADSRADTDPSRIPPPPSRPLALEVPAFNATDSLEAAAAIHAALQAASDALGRALPKLEQATAMAVNHPVTPGQLRGEVDSAHDHVFAAAAVFENGVAVMWRTLRKRLGTGNVCPECQAGAVEPSQEPWHYAGCSHAVEA